MAGQPCPYLLAGVPCSCSKCVAVNLQGVFFGVSAPDYRPQTLTMPSGESQGANTTTSPGSKSSRHGQSLPPSSGNATTHAGQHPHYPPYTETQQSMPAARSTGGYHMREFIRFEAHKRNLFNTSLLGTQTVRHVPLAPGDANPQTGHQELLGGSTRHPSTGKQSSPGRHPKAHEHIANDRKDESDGGKK